MAANIRREITDGLQVQGVDEEIIYRLNTANWGGTPTAPVAAAFKRNVTTQLWEDVTATVFPTNTPTISGDYIVLSKLQDLVVDGEYRVEVKWTHPGGSLVEAFARIKGEL